MCRLLWALLCVVLFRQVLLVYGEEADDATAEMLLSDQVRKVLEHFKQEDPVGIPGAPIPDPLPVPDMTRYVAMTTMVMQELRVYGLPRFRIAHLRTELATMRMSVAMTLELINIVGQYTMKYFFSSSQGVFNITLTDVHVQGEAKMSIVRNGQLQVENIDMDISFQSMNMELESAAISEFFRGIITSMAPFIFESIKPYILKEVNQNMRGDMNKEVSKLPQRFPNSISPLDYIISDARDLVLFMGYDPYKLPDYTYSTGMSTIKLSHIWLTGLGTFYRTGNITLAFEEHAIKAGAHVGTLKLGGRCHWDLEIGMFSRSGVAEFSVGSLDVNTQVSQPLDTRNNPNLDRFDFKLGNFEIRVDGTGSFDYIIEIVANVLPNLLRYQIMHTVETKARIGIQQALDKIDVEQLIEKHLKDLDEMAN